MTPDTTADECPTATTASTGGRRSGRQGGDDPVRSPKARHERLAKEG
jgi:hypothetical protein